MLTFSNVIPIDACKERVGFDVFRIAITPKSFLLLAQKPAYETCGCLAL